MVVLSGLFGPVVVGPKRVLGFRLHLFFIVTQSSLSTIALHGAPEAPFFKVSLSEVVAS